MITISLLENHHHLATELMTTIFYYPLQPLARLAILAVSNAISLSPSKYSTWDCVVGKMLATRTHALAHRGHMFLPVLHLAFEVCVQEISVAGILLAAVVVLCLS